MVAQQNKFFFFFVQINLNTAPGNMSILEFLIKQLFYLGLLYMK